mmetsp:Transcript_113667/g.326702  ORF Transcript_113667/g.326702 Transcript_113667/m.326702 type:complete len:717 (-) Transcript_113667:71-2221(-)
MAPSPPPPPPAQSAGVVLADRRSLRVMYHPLEPAGVVEATTWRLPFFARFAPVGLAVVCTALAGTAALFGPPRAAAIGASGATVAKDEVFAEAEDEDRGQCGYIEEGMEYKTGSDLRAIFNVSSVEECCAECESEPACRAWSWGAAAEVENVTDVCFLKGLAVGTRAIRARNPDIVSGLPDRADPELSLHQLWQNCGSIEAGIEFRTGIDLWVTPKPVPSPESCCAYCEGHTDCRAWTFVQHTLIKNLSGLCFIKGLKDGSEPKRVKNPDFVSGLATERHMVISREVAANPRSCGSIELDVNFRTQFDLEAEAGVPTAEMCCALCEGHARCEAWTWAWKDLRCFLKGLGNATEPVREKGQLWAVSGLPLNKFAKEGRSEAPSASLATSEELALAMSTMASPKEQLRCPGVLHVQGLGDVALNNLVGEGPDGVKLGAPLAVGRGGDEVVPTMWTRTYFGQSCQSDGYDPSRYLAINFLGRTFKYTADISGLGCGCNAALYLTSMRQNREPSEGKDFYCDAAKVGGVPCGEIDVQEANQFAWLSTMHAYNATWGENGADRLGQSMGFGGSNGHAASRDWTAVDYGPGARCIDTQRPFQVSTSFHTNAAGDFAGWEVVLSQDGCELRAKTSEYIVAGQSNVLLVEHRDGLRELGHDLRAGMTPIISYWKSKDMLWMDGVGDDGQGPCVADRPHECPHAVRFYDFSIEALAGAATHTVQI